MWTFGGNGSKPGSVMREEGKQNKLTSVQTSTTRRAVVNTTTLFYWAYLETEVVIADEVSVLEVDLSHGQHSLPVPLVEPVDGAAVDERRIHATSLAELTPCWAHG